MGLPSDACEDIKATFFHYSRTRSQKVVLELIDGFKGYLTTDAYAVYANMHLEDVKKNFCWSHLRRYANYFYAPLSGIQQETVRYFF